MWRECAVHSSRALQCSADSSRKCCLLGVLQWRMAAYFFRCLLILDLYACKRYHFIRQCKYRASAWRNLFVWHTSKFIDLQYVAISQKILSEVNWYVFCLFKHCSHLFLRLSAKVIIWQKSFLKWLITTWTDNLYLMCKTPILCTSEGVRFWANSCLGKIYYCRES